MENKLIIQKKGENLLSSPLGNRIKSLRQKHNLSQTVLAEQLGISHAYVGFLEKGMRSGSDKTLQKLGEYFRVPYEELLELRDEKMEFEKEMKPPSGRNRESNTYPPHIEEFVSLLMKLEESTCKSVIEEFKKDLQEKLYQMLTPYDARELKQMVLDVKRYWLALVDSTNTSPRMEEKEGYISMNERELYFHLHLDESVLVISLLYQDQGHINLFENWIGESTIRYVSQKPLQHLSESQKVSTFLWFSPTSSTVDRFHYVRDNINNINNVQCNDHQLNWFIQQHLLDMQNEASAG
ncbi:helix-turn-helix domain-containing protein [Pontibacillus yanchengensis]|uniref:Helix-turn-helix domain-containing protein n=1 Tax=Pontibacillus yanchengensis TaxID=462910 RepID=A0ACC7VFR2_9BACI|nr:helix-turn-helix transcriptional regulator [Pontibacillus yanchengensis]MYL53751.1 helix-turn-helix domain-containing protein [Pontibacillus yanchengensis]